MGRKVDGKADVTASDTLAATKIAFYGKLHPKRKVTFIEELKRLARHYGLKVEATGGKSKARSGKR
ncbi:MAG TPA: hypothetical protein VKF40_25700 [Burkholderiales bacterium]|nr:hypothetical protein [Burkholderiales bacterium]